MYIRTVVCLITVLLFNIQAVFLCHKISFKSLPVLLKGSCHNVCYLHVACNFKRKGLIILEFHSKVDKALDYKEENSSCLNNVASVTIVNLKTEPCWCTSTNFERNFYLRAWEYLRNELFERDTIKDYVLQSKERVRLTSN